MAFLALRDAATLAKQAKKNKKRKQAAPVSATRVAAAIAAAEAEEKARLEELRRSQDWQAAAHRQKASRVDGVAPPDTPQFGNAGMSAAALRGGGGRGAGATKPAWMVQKEREEASSLDGKDT